MSLDVLLQQLWFQTLLFCLATAGIIALLYGLIQLAKGLKLWLELRRKEGRPAHILEQMLMPILTQAIVTVYELSEHSLDLFGRQLTTIDKQEAARLTYDYLKDLKIKVPGLPISIRLGDLVTLVQWSTFVQSAFDKLIALYLDAKKGLLDELRPVAS